MRCVLRRVFHPASVNRWDDLTLALPPAHVLMENTVAEDDAELPF